MKTAMRPDILLVHPWIHDFAAYDLWVAPLGLLYLAAALRKQGCAVQLLDCLDCRHPALTGTPESVSLRRHPDGRGKFFRQEIPRPAALQGIPRPWSRYGISPAVIREDLKKRRPPDVVFVTSHMTYWYPGVVETIGVIREVWPAVPIFLGGIYATLCPDHAARAGANRVFPGPAEDRLPAILREIGVPLPPGEVGRPAPLPSPAWDLFLPRIWAPLLASRGCPFRCTYCASFLLFPSFRQGDPLAVANDIRRLQQQGVGHFVFYDDALLARPEEMILPLLRELSRRGTHAVFHCPNGLHLREMTPEMVGLLFRTGFRTLRFGFETADPGRQGATGGKVQSDDLIRAVRCLRDAGYAPRDLGVYLLCGLPGQEPEEVEEAIRFVAASGARPLLAEYAPIPGTPLWPEAVAASPVPLAREPLFHNNTLLPCRARRFTFARLRQLRDLARSASDGP